MAQAHPWPALLEQLLQGDPLSTEQATALMHGWLAQQIDPVLTGGLLVALRAKGVTGGELAAMAAVLRQACPMPAARPSFALVDTCGTGGDGADSFNISTAVAFVAAACGAPVAKHGNRSASGRVGSADVLEALGLHLQAPAEQVIGALADAGLTFLFAPGWHPALVGLAPLRRTLGVRTVFNLLGPLVNPLRPEAQVLGVARPELLDPMAEALAQLGLRRAVVVHGHGGLDEASLAGVNALRLVENGAVQADQLDPEQLGLARAPLAALAGGDLATNRTILEAVLQGRGTQPQQDVVALNTALVLWAAGRADSVADGLQQAQQALAAGGGWQALERLRAALPAPAAG
ncbi:MULTISPECIES: anthranilate phosphoribosyltransferase [Synechococcales]|jgi:anthranilate phosphoribosyltransferase|uniref:anthranilate phosphoribosyltransferase n=1 Tax=Synechococcales TaxID=1890424 RepID=UPI000B97E131|nr:MULTISPECIES: anthranilate phosphoribosyltransferase [Synechococcales]MCP9941289.1 anthranilate phosphoribosyltransferase [Cyanobium sp. ATX 6E8]